MDCKETVVQPGQVVVPQFDVELGIVSILCVMDAERRYYTSNRCDVGCEELRTENGALRNAKLTRDGSGPIVSDTDVLLSILQICPQPLKCWSGQGRLHRGEWKQLLPS